MDGGMVVVRLLEDIMAFPKTQFVITDDGKPGPGVTIHPASPKIRVVTDKNVPKYCELQSPTGRFLGKVTRNFLDILGGTYAQIGEAAGMKHLGKDTDQDAVIAQQQADLAAKDALIAALMAKAGVTTAPVAPSAPIPPTNPVKGGEFNV